jgi:hypothetical protein
MAKAINAVAAALLDTPFLDYRRAALIVAECVLR